MQRIAKSEVTLYLLSQGLFRTGQRGFLQEKSCRIYMIDSLSLVAKAAKGWKSLFDMGKVFDRVLPRELLVQIKNCDIDGPKLAWFYS